MRVAVVGSRENVSKDRVGEYVCSLPEGTVVVTGGARGVDEYAGHYARLMGFEVCIWEADWDSLGKAAGPVRNELIVEDVDRVVAFWDGESRGTKNTIDLALKMKKDLEVYF